jgi:predicted  nucleic acid-binding Zn-ribbon protein
MKSGRYDSNVTLLCPTCGGTQFEYNDDEIHDDHATVRCVTCNREMTKDELIHKNSENIEEHISEISKESVDDLARELKKTFKKVLSGNKNIKLK